MTRSDYADKLKDPRWQRKRLEILQRDNFTCLDCGAKRATLHIHHCFYIYGKDPWDYEDRTLRTLCDECHEARPEWEKSAVAAFKIFLAGRSRQEIYRIVSTLKADQAVVTDRRFEELKRFVEQLP
jgi:hypothetical protein